MKTRQVLAFSLLGLLVGCAGFSAATPETAPLRPVVFHYEGLARSVCITGDFNQWDTESHCMQRDKQGWSIRLLLPPGPAHYAFFLDGKRWELDPKALFVESDGFGKYNSVVMIE
jgi:hypothetical protein